MSERTLHRAGAGAAIVGAVLALVLNVLHPRVSDFENPARSLLREVAASNSWLQIHLGLLLAIVLISLGLFAWTRTIADRVGSWSRLALGTLVVSLAAAVVTLSVDGYAVKAAADAIPSGPVLQDMSGPLAAGIAVADVSWGLFMMFIITFLGLTPIAFGLAARADGSWPYYFGWPVVTLGVASIVEAVLGTLYGPEPAFFSAFVVTSILLTVWAFALGVVLWRRLAPQAAPTAPARRRPPAKRPAARRTRG